MEMKRKNNTEKKFLAIHDYHFERESKWVTWFPIVFYSIYVISFGLGMVLQTGPDCFMEENE